MAARTGCMIFWMTELAPSMLELKFEESCLPFDFHLAIHYWKSSHLPQAVKGDLDSLRDNVREYYEQQVSTTCMQWWDALDLSFV